MSDVILRMCGDDFVIECGPRDTAFCRAIPGVSAGKANPARPEVEWRCPATWYHAIVLRNVFGGRLSYGEDVAEWGRFHAETESLLKYIRTVPTQPLGWGLFPYQDTGSSFLATAGRGLLADEPGLGKTAQSICAMRLLGRSSLPALVVTTTSTKYAFAAEFEKWWPGLDVRVLGGSVKQRQDTLSSGADVIVTNWELLAKHSRLAKFGSIALTAEEKTDKELNTYGFRTVIADEAHRAKDPKAKQTRALWAIGQDAKHRFALTGTPIANAQVDLWSVLHFLDPKVWPSRSKFIDRYVSGYQTDWGFVPTGWQSSNRDELMRFVDQYLIRRTKSEVLPDLPPKIYDRRLIDLTPKQAKAYRDMRKELLSFIDGNALVAGDPLTKAGRLLQIASAMPVLEKRTGVDPDTGAEASFTEVVGLGAPSNKVAALLEFLSEGDAPVVVFAQSRKLIDLAQESLLKEGISCVRITGAEDAETRAANVSTFQAGGARVALVTTAAGSEGITLTRASVVVFLQRPWSLVQSKQAEDRVHRIGQEAGSVLVVDFVSAGTIDEKVYETLVKKGETLDSVTRDSERLRGML